MKGRPRERHTGPEDVARVIYDDAWFGRRGERKGRQDVVRMSVYDHDVRLVTDATQGCRTLEMAPTAAIEAYRSVNEQSGYLVRNWPPALARQSNAVL